VKVYLTAFRTQLKLTGEYARITDLAGILKNSGLDLEIITSGKNRFKVKAKRAEGFWVHLSDLFSVLKQVMQLRKTRCIIFIMLPTPSFALLADIIKFYTHNPVIVYFESQLTALSLRELIINLKAEFGFYFFRLFFNNNLWSKISRFTADKYIVSSQFQASEIIEAGASNSKTVVIRNWVSLRDKNKGKNQLRLKYAISPDIPLVCYLGHFFHVKGVDLLLSAFKIVRKKYPDVRLLLAWSGLGNEKPIKKLILKLGLEDTIIQVGKVRQSDVFTCCDALVLPYRYAFGTQIIPNTLVEAISIGIPLVTSDLPAISEIISGETGILCNPHKPQEISEAIMSILGMGEKANLIRDNQKKLFKSMFDRKTIARKYVDTINSAKNTKSDKIELCQKNG